MTNKICENCGFYSNTSMKDWGWGRCISIERGNDNQKHGKPKYEYVGKNFGCIHWQLKDSGGGE